MTTSSDFSLLRAKAGIGIQDFADQAGFSRPHGLSLGERCLGATTGSSQATGINGAQGPRRAGKRR